MVRSMARGYMTGMMLFALLVGVQPFCNAYTNANSRGDNDANENPADENLCLGGAQD